MAEQNGKSTFAYERKTAWNRGEDDKIFAFAEDYKRFIDRCKTERETTNYLEQEAVKLGFKPFSQAKFKTGEKIYLINHHKNVILAVIGKADLTQGANIIVSHIDSPRLDLKPLPLYEGNNIALLKTQYYGGIKKYQWLNIPMSLHGRVVKSDGEYVDIVIGEDDNDPVFTIPDLLPHLAKKVQGEKKFFEGIEGENLNLVVGNIPVEDENIKERVKETVLSKLNETYGINEEDFISAELEAVPSYKARDVGIDRSMIGAYGHDDRVCSYAAFRALKDMDKTPDKTTIAFLVDKEEIGSYGISSIRSKFFAHSLARFMEMQNPDYRPSDLFKLYENSVALSGDVGGLVNPMFTAVHDLYNSPVMGCGVIIEKYTGSRGKYGASDASAELMGKIRKLFNENDVKWQPGVLGRVDEGGGGTVAFEIAELGIQVVDSGVGVIGMHAPFEIISKVDLYETYKAYKVFLEKA
jgi:aspartyl aminopeptidase